MSSAETQAEKPVGVGAVGVQPDESLEPCEDGEDAVLVELPQGDLFRLVAFCDEGLETPGTRNRPVPYYYDYNMLLEDPAVELVLVDGPVELRRDYAVRALNAGRHVVLPEPFCEAAIDAERVMKTALRSGLVATMDLKWRDDPDLLALCRAVREENVSAIHGAFCFWSVQELPASLGLAVSSSDALEPAGVGLLEQVGMAVLYQMRVLIRDDVKSVSAHVYRAGPGAADERFLIYLALRGGGWAIAQSAAHNAAVLPRWVLYAARATFTAGGGTAIVITGDERRTYAAPEEPEDFWQNLYAAVRGGAELKCHPVDIVRAMKLHEAALESAELGQPVTV